MMGVGYLCHQGEEEKVLAAERAGTNAAGQGHVDMEQGQAAWNHTRLVGFGPENHS